MLSARSCMDYICTYQNYSSFLSRCLNLQFKQSNQFGKSKNAFKNVDGLISMTVYSYPPSYTNHDYMYIICTYQNYSKFFIKMLQFTA